MNSSFKFNGLSDPAARLFVKRVVMGACDSFLTIWMAVFFCGGLGIVLLLGDSETQKPEWASRAGPRSNVCLC